jgi:hypothetical protein
MWRLRGVMLFVVGAFVLTACDDPSPAARPREGASTATVTSTTGSSVGAAVPPTLAPATPSIAPTPSGPAPILASPTAAPNHVIASTGVGAVNLRAGPSTSAPVITTLREGTPVEAVGDPVSAEGRAWQQVRCADQEGWVVAGVVH